MTNTNLVFYIPGCYGTFFEWILGYLTGDLDQLPFEKTGSSHQYQGNMLYPPKRLFEYVENGETEQFARAHPNLKMKQIENDYATVLQEDFTYLQQHFNNIVSLVRDQQSRLWVDNNVLDKCLISPEDIVIIEQLGYNRGEIGFGPARDPIGRIKHILNREIERENAVFTKQNLQGWNKDSLDDFDLWELRELLSLYWFTTSDVELAGWKVFKQNCKHPIITMESLRDSDTFMSAVLGICKHFDVTAQQDRLKKLEEIYPVWRDKQIHIDKDKLCKQIADSVTTGNDINWSEDKLSLFDEAWIQKLLRDNGNELRCYNLNDFPTTTKELRDVTQ